MFISRRADRSKLPLDRLISINTISGFGFRMDFIASNRSWLWPTISISLNPVRRAIKRSQRTFEPPAIKSRIAFLPSIPPLPGYIYIYIRDIRSLFGKNLGGDVRQFRPFTQKFAECFVGISPTERE